MFSVFQFLAQNEDLSEFEAGEKLMNKVQEFDLIVLTRLAND